jgi:hypothetical protein
MNIDNYECLGSENVSLFSLLPEYKEFVSSLDSSFKSKRKLMAEWSRATTDSTISESMNDQPDIYSHIPSLDCYRFAWGDYTALSYVWGDETKTRTTFINGHEVAVTQNLEEALRAFRLQSEFQSGFKIWVDAICLYVDRYRTKYRRNLSL